MQGHRPCPFFSSMKKNLVEAGEVQGPDQLQGRVVPLLKTSVNFAHSVGICTGECCSQLSMEMLTQVRLGCRSNVGNNIW